MLHGLLRVYMHAGDGARSPCVTFEPSIYWVRRTVGGPAPVLAT